MTKPERFQGSGFGFIGMWESPVCRPLSNNWSCSSERCLPSPLSLSFRQVGGRALFTLSSIWNTSQALTWHLNYSEGKANYEFPEKEQRLGVRPRLTPQDRNPSVPSASRKAASSIASDLPSCLEGRNSSNKQAKNPCLKWNKNKESSLVYSTLSSSVPVFLTQPVFSQQMLDKR